MEAQLKDTPTWFKGYIAGIIDGEGYVHVNKAGHGMRYWTPGLTIGMTKLEIIATLFNSLGMGSISVEKKPSKKHKDCYRITIRAVLELHNLFEAVRPYLIIKRRHAELIIEFCELKLTNRFSEADGQRIHDELNALNK